MSLASSRTILALIMRKSRVLTSVEEKRVAIQNLNAKGLIGKETVKLGYNSSTVHRRINRNSYKISNENKHDKDAHNDTR